MEAKNIQLGNISKKFTKLKSMNECPKLYLINQFENCVAEVDFTAEKLMQSKQISIDVPAINENRNLMIEKINQFEKNCIDNFNKKAVNKNSKNINETIKLFEIKINKLNQNSTELELEDMENLIDYELYSFKKNIFCDKNILFLNKELCDDYIFNCNNYDDIYDTKPDEEHKTMINFFGILIQLNEYISKNKFIYHRMKSLANIQLTKEIIEICFAAKKIKEYQYKIPIIEINLNDLYLLTEIDLSNQVFKSIKNSSFEGFNQLNKLVLKSANLNRFKAEAFIGLDNLKLLKVYKYGDPRRHFVDPLYKKNSTTQTELNNENIFQHLINLENLDLSNYLIKSFNVKLFNGLENLKSLNISFNHLDRLEPKCFSSLTSLEELNLRSNSLDILKNDYFSGLKNLKLLNLEGNGIESIESNAFAPLQHLKYLNLGYNSLNELKNMFKDLYNLKELNLAENGLNELNADYFNGLSQLEVLGLDGNMLRYETIQSDTFDSLEDLNELSLDGNLLEKIDNLFKNLINLEKLRLALNQLSYIDSNCFRSLTKLKILDLLCNQIKNITDDSFICFNTLEAIDLSRNKLKFISSNIFNSTAKTLKEINLSKNPLLNLDQIVFDGIDKSVIIFNTDLDFEL